MGFVEKTFLIGGGIKDGAGGQLYGTGAPYIALGVQPIGQDVIGPWNNDPARYDYVTILFRCTVMPAGESATLLWQINEGTSANWVFTLATGTNLTTAGNYSLIVPPPIGHTGRAYVQSTGAKAAAMTFGVSLEFKRVGQ